LREREALEEYAKNLISENNKLKGSVNQSHNTLIQSAKKQVEGELAMAKKQYTAKRTNQESLMPY
jgi:hypothetical protein